MLHISTRKEIEEYFLNPALDQSKLKKLLSGKNSFLTDSFNSKNLYFEEKGHFIIGGAVDTKLTAVEQDFDDLYYVSDCFQKPSDAIKSIIHRVYDLSLEQMLVDGAFKNPHEFELWKNWSLEDSLILVTQAIEEAEYQSKWKMETRIQKIIEWDMYYQDLKKAFGKQVISDSENIIIENVVDSLRTNEYTKNIFNRSKQALEPNIDVYYQLPIYFQYRGRDCKALLDIVFVYKNQEGEIVLIQPWDLKTMSGNTISFPTSLFTRRYDIQAAWYTLALSLMFPNVIINPFRFVVESTTEPGNPLIYTCEPSLLQIGKSGRKELRLAPNKDLNGFEEILRKSIQGYDNLLDELDFYESINFAQEKEAYLNKGCISIDFNGIVPFKG